MAGGAAEVDAHHTPVLLSEVVTALGPGPGGRFVDCTVGGAGHTLALLERGAEVLGIDLDPDVLKVAERRSERHRKQLRLVAGSFADLESIAAENGFSPVDGVLMDLGLSSLQVDTAARGFSINRESRLDMRFDSTQQLTAHKVVNTYTERQIADLIHQYGEERAARRIARAIVRERPVDTTTQLAEIVAGSVRRRPGSRIHPATRTFQAIRMTVNRELDNLKSGLEGAVRILAAPGRLAVISYHSLEDRMVKSFVRLESLRCVCPPITPTCVCSHTARLKPVNKRVIKPSETEIYTNRRSRSARLRVAERLYR